MTCFDPDAPTGSGFWHWVLVNLPGRVTELRRRGVDAGCPAARSTSATTTARSDYGGAAPPPADRPHRYMFAVHALDVDKIEVSADASPAYVGFNLAFHTLARGYIAPVYET